MTTEEQQIVDSLRDQGYAVVIFTPDELDGASPDKVEDNLVSSGWEAIDVLK